jgi:protein CpxP
MTLSLPSIRGLRAFMIGSVFALGSAVALSSWAGPHGGHGGHGDLGGPMAASPERMGRMVDRLLDGAEASDAQRAQVKQIVAAAGADLKAQHEAGRALREQQLQLFTQPTVDANAVERLRQQRLAQHDQASKRMTQAMLEISRVLTPEQRVKIAERMKARRDAMRGQRGEHRKHEPRG